MVGPAVAAVLVVVAVASLLVAVAVEGFVAGTADVAAVVVLPQSAAY